MTLQILVVTCCVWLTVVQIHGARLDEACGDTTACFVPGSGCGPDGKCHCGGDTPRQTDDGFCAPNDLKLVGESCSDSSPCMSFSASCISSVCVCKTEFRVGTPEEIIAEPETWNFLGKCRDKTTGVDVVDVDQSCSSNENCPQNAECATDGVSKKCKCTNGTITSDNFHSCLTVKTLGEKCNNETECATKFSYCKPEDDGVCTCHPSHFPHKNNSLCKRIPYSCLTCVKEWATLGDECGGDGVECDDDLVCNETCGCKDGFRVASFLERKTFFLRGYCIRNEIKIGPTLKVFDSCKNTTAPCPVNSKCQAVGCVDRLCVCQNEMLASEDKTECLRVVDLGKNCSGSGLTCTKRAECSAEGVCVCQSLFHSSENGKRCKKVSLEQDVTYSLLTESCDDENVFCEDARKQKCVTGKCECKAGNRAVTETEFLTIPKFTECVPDEFFIGTAAEAKEKCVDGEVDLGEKCYSDANCPQNAECAPVGCDRKCQCKRGTIISNNFQSCLEVKYLGQPCNTSTECSTKYSFCKPEQDGVCTCYPSHFANGVFCKRRPYPCSSCVKEWATLGNECGGVGVECDDDLVCNKTSTTCGCKDGYRVATLLERKTFFLRGYCIRNEIKIEYSDEEYEKNCVTTKATTPLTTESTTTETKSTTIKAETTTTESETTTTESETTTTKAETTTTKAETTTTKAETTTSKAETTTTESETTTSEAETTTTEAETTTTESETTTTESEITTTIDPLCLKEDSILCIIADVYPRYKIYVNKKNCPHINGDCPVVCGEKQPAFCKTYAKSNCKTFPSFNRTCLDKCDLCGCKYDIICELR